jgi:HK97 gp10 family phage protein
MAEFKVVVSGIENVQSLLSKVIKDIESNAELNKKVSSIIAKNASAIAPKLSGALASSIVAKGSSERAQVVAGSSAVPYAGVTEYGWPQRGREAKPYLRPAVNNNMKQIVQEYSEGIDKAIRRYNLQ